MDETESPLRAMPGQVLEKDSACALARLWRGNPRRVRLPARQERTSDEKGTRCHQKAKKFFCSLDLLNKGT
ncbi:hypothetical protein [Pseudomonas sp. WS 5027]|uniref:hypothetical protein n=1 Tax=Pseudomonas sp. WS 5027 TaxID=2717483 RepID=UPI001473F448|nr:hypothetical protein [Pseudomonas sp. WS 5027]NMY49094.1 hypothetical protein [Pseudomonas sp. WS 5027]